MVKRATSIFNSFCEQSLVFFLKQWPVFVTFGMWPVKETSPFPLDLARGVHARESVPLPSRAFSHARFARRTAKKETARGLSFRTKTRIKHITYNIIWYHTLGSGNQRAISSLIPRENVGISISREIRAGLPGCHSYPVLLFSTFFVVFQEKLCLEIAGGFEESMAQKVQEELEQVERQVFVFEKEETELRLVRSIFVAFAQLVRPLV